MSHFSPAVLALEDGTTFVGQAFGAAVTATGEVCFNTGMTGYQEVLTDPSYHGQIVTMTAPQIGNTGVNDHDDQSRRPWVAGFVVRDAARMGSSWRATGSLDDYLARREVPAVAGIDTRRLTRHLTTHGAMRGALSTDESLGPDDLVDIARQSPSMVGRDLAIEVTTPEPYRWGADDLRGRAVSGYAAGAEHSPATAALLKDLSGSGAAWKGPQNKNGFSIAAFDFGLKRNILDLLVASGCDVTVVPATTPAESILSKGYDGVFLSNGPGDPEPVGYAIDTVRALLGRIPVFGICLGHQILGLALGAKTFKLPFGHRGSNHPVAQLPRNLPESGAAWDGTQNKGAAWDGTQNKGAAWDGTQNKIEITCQNHGFAVDPESIEGTTARLTHVNLNDNTVEGLEVPGVAFSVQYHPEAGPGPHDSRYLFARFTDLMQTFEPWTSN